MEFPVPSWWGSFPREATKHMLILDQSPYKFPKGKDINNSVVVNVEMQNFGKQQLSP